MGLESGTYINSLNENNPDGATDAKSQGDNHLRLIKSTIKNTFPGIAFPVGFATIGGAANAYTMTLSPAPSSYVNGMLVYGRVSGAIGNTGSSTLNVNSLGAKTIKKHNNLDLESGDIIQNGVYLFVYNSTTGFFEMLSPPGQKNWTLSGTTARLDFLETDEVDKNIRLNLANGVFSVQQRADDGTSIQTMLRFDMPNSKIELRLDTELVGVKISGNGQGLTFPINNQSGGYTFALTDQGTMVRSTSSSAQTFTVPPNSSVAFPTGTIIMCCQGGSGQLTIAAGSGVTIETEAGLKINARHGVASLYKRTTNTWVAFGSLKA
jgi:hypothetical protein